MIGIITVLVSLTSFGLAVASGSYGHPPVNSIVGTPSACQGGTLDSQGICHYSAQYPIQIYGSLILLVIGLSVVYLSYKKRVIKI